MIEESDKITLEDLVNECKKLDIECIGDMNQQNSSENSSAIRISIKGMYNETAFLNVYTIYKPLIKCRHRNDLRFADFARINLTNAICVVNKDMRKQCVKQNQSPGRKPLPMLDHRSVR
ncbi:unnamed protein product [Hymenolepis diminuta]|uniref:Uncharacterized protein n=1 Tax=Hymenolepis diminuta TaxID=6216 RepID=A0A564YGB8_HYMDI|nr:unnamed protein product [Hymenolepis diminuta]